MTLIDKLPSARRENLLARDGDSIRVIIRLEVLKNRSDWKDKQMMHTSLHSR
jgi:hypothetical protein